MNNPPQIPDNDIAKFSLDIWEEAGLVATTPHKDGTFYHSSLFPAASEFNFFLPAFGATGVSPDTLRDITAFYAARNAQPVIYCPDSMIAGLGDHASEVKFREVMMRADIDNVLAPAAQHGPDKYLSFRKMNDFTDPDYHSVYNSVFLSPDSHSQYDDIYRAFLDTFGRAAKGSTSYSPWLVLGTLDGTPASGATIVPRGALAGLYNVATKPELRGRGLAAQTMHEAFRHARDGGAKTLFLITETGSALEKTYARMGFSTFARYSAIALKQ